MRTLGLTLITTLVYVSLLAVVVVVLSRLTAGLLHANAKAQLAGEVIDSAHSASAAITQEIKTAEAVYTPTSALSTSPGQLSLATTHNLPADETVTYVDFYVDDEHLYVKREGQAAQILTSPRVKVSNLIFTHLNPAGAHSAVRLEATFTADVPDSALQTQTTMNVTSTTALRAY